MQEAVASLLGSWHSFYSIIGSSAAALTGLMFVVITLIARTEMSGSGDGIAAFGTPNVTHFGAALFIAALLSAPWPTFWSVSILLGLCGLAGVIYIIIVIRRARRQTDYEPVLEDWLWHIIFPLASYAALFVAAIVLPINPASALFVVGAAAVLFLFIGIHNSWDTVTYFIITRPQPQNKSQE